MKIGLIDVDGHNFPNLALMKISAFHKSIGDYVEWYDPLTGFVFPYDKVYMSKVFSFTEDYMYPIYANYIERGGSGYCIETINGKEAYNRAKDKTLPYEIEHIYPDYDLYPEITKDTAYGFLTRGCPRGCNFCHVEAKEGRKSYKVANLSEFWRGQKNIVLLDPNITACAEWKDLFQQLIDSKANVDFTQGLDLRLLTEQKLEMLKIMKVKNLHFAFDRIEDKDVVIPKLELVKRITGYNRAKVNVFVLVGDRERRVTEDDLFRIYKIRDIGFSPYVMIYDKASLPPSHELKRLQRWVNNRVIFFSCNKFEDYCP